MCRVALLCLFPAVCLLHAALNPAATALPVTVLLDFEQPHSSASLDAMQQELNRLLSPVRLKVDLRLKAEVPESAEFGELLLFKMKGSCTMKALPIGALSDERGPLAMTYSSNGQILSFGEVECDRVRESLQRVFGKRNPDAHEAAYGVALARVMAHEMYHMMGNCAAHTKHGLTKESLSGRELSEDTLPLAAEATDALRKGH